MFKLDEMLKSWLLAKLNPDTTMHFLLNRYWDQMVLYMLIAPCQWLHLAHLLYTTDWDEYNILSKILLVVYATLCFLGWEMARIFAYYTCRAVSSGEDVTAIASRVASAVNALSKEGVKLAAPVVTSLTKSATHLLSKAKEIAMSTGGNANGGNANGSNANGGNANGSNANGDSANGRSKTE